MSIFCFPRILVTAVVLLGCGAGASLAHSPHVVQPGETLGSIARQHLGSTARWREIAAANRLANPHRIAPGTVLLIPSLDAPDVATHVAGTGEYRESAEKPWRQLSAGTAIPPSGEVRTATDGLVTVRTAEGVQLQIRGRSVVRLPPAEDGTRSLVLQRGAVAARSDRRAGGAFKVVTPVAVAGVRGTHFLVDYDADALRNSVSVWEGMANHSAEDITVDVGAGYGSWALSGAPPSPAVPLPAAPELVAPAARAEIAAPAVDFRWRAATGATAYLLEIGRDPEFTRLDVMRVVEGAAGDSIITARVGHLTTGALYWRVSSRNANALEGSSAPARLLTIADPLVTLRRLYRERAFGDVVTLVNEMDSPGFRPAMLRAWAYYRLGLIDQAENAFRRMSESSPGNDEIMLGLAYCAFRSGRNEEAESAFRDVLRLDPASSEALLGIAHIRYRQERWEEAIDFYERCLRLSPGNSEAEEYLLEARTKSGH